MLSEEQRQELRVSIRDAAARQQANVVLNGVRQLIRGSSKPNVEAMFCASALERVTERLIEQKVLRRIKTFVVRSVTLEPVVPFFKIEAVLLGLALEMELGGYGSYVDEMMSPVAALARYAPELIFVVLDLEDIAGTLPALCANGREALVEEEVASAVERLRSMLQSVRSFCTARIVLQGFVLPDTTSLGDVGDANLDHSLPHAVRRLNERIASMCRSIVDCVFFDVDQIAARHGRRSWRDRRMFLASRLAVSAESSGAYAKALARSAASLLRAQRKVLCTDLDNTLWGGILGEDGPEGIATGSAFPGNCYLDYQRYLKQLASRGILLAAVSKNNETDVTEAFDRRAADLALTLDDFVAKKINWNSKAQSLREIAAELSLGLDSFVFVDDNPVECEEIRQELPEVAVVGVPVDEPWRLVEMLADQPFFDSAVVTEDDINRVQEYRAQAQRADLANSATNREEFLASLEIVCTFLPATDAPLNRAVQLLSKTNQFNLTTRRHPSTEVEHFAAADKAQAIAVRVRDRFGDAGVVGLALAENEGDTCRIDSLLLSCRVIGRGIESALLAELASRARRSGARRLVGEYIPTRKNVLCADFYTTHGFERTEPAAGAPAESVFYEFDLSRELAFPAWLTLEGTEQYELAAGPSVAS